MIRLDEAVDVVALRLVTMVDRCERTSAALRTLISTTATHLVTRRRQRRRVARQRTD